jgi:hypothetical protein
MRLPRFRLRTLIVAVAVVAWIVGLYASALSVHHGITVILLAVGGFTFFFVWLRSGIDLIRSSTRLPPRRLGRSNPPVAPNPPP